MPGAYAGIRVVDLSQGFAGPYAAALLADQGADVVKVEPPNGDWARNIGARHGDNTSFGMVPNIGKRSIRVDAHTEDGREVLNRLARGADVLVQNYRPEAARRLGMDAETLRAADPRLVHVTISGFGRTGPAAGRPATDTILQGWSGLARLGADADGRPRPLGFSVIDVAAGIYAAQRIGAALYEQARWDRGGEIEVSLLESAVALQGAPLLDSALAHLAGGPAGGPSRLAVPLGIYPTADGEMMLSCVNDRMFAGIREVLGLDATLGADGLDTAERRFARADEIDDAVTAALRGRTSQEWIALLSERGVLCGPVHAYPDVLRDPAVRAAGVFRAMTGPDGTVDIARFPGSPDRTEGPVRPPECGEHTEEILRELGLRDADGVR